MAKEFGYARYTTTIRAAWIQAVDTLTECLLSDLRNAACDRLEAETDYLRDERFAAVRAVAKRHRSLGVTLQLYVGLFKHFRDLYLEALDEISLSPDETASVRRRALGFFDAAELSIGADWAEAPEQDRLKELQSRARGVALEKDRYFSVFESLRDPAFLLDRQRQLLNANQAAAELFVGEAGAGEIVYLSAMQSRKSLLEEVLLSVSSGDRAGSEPVWLDTKRGSRCFDVREREIHDAVENMSLGYVVILHDVTAHRKATEEAEQARRAMSSFLATMSHEIRTPLHCVLGATELLRDAEVDRHQTYVDAIDGAGRHLLQTLNKVLDYSKLEARQPEPTPQPRRLKSVFEEYGRFASVWARQAEIPLTVSIARNLPRFAMIDWEMTQQVLTNLVSNAIRHDSGRGVEIRIRRRLRAGQGAALRFEVFDHGPGIEPEWAPTLFEPFGALSPGVAGTGGAGLGLAISRRLVEAMGGTIGYRNRAEGAAFWFDLPYAAVPAAEVDTISASGDSAIRSGGETGSNCLLIDDDPIGTMVTADQLARHGFAVATASSAAEAMELARGTRFETFVIDYHLPDSDGATLAANLRADRRENRAGRYVALTANADMIALADNDGHPFDAVLSKPVSSEAILAAIRAVGSGSDHDRQTMGASAPANALAGVSPQIVSAMAAAFIDKWGDEVATFNDCLEAGNPRQVADIAHRLASSCAVMGIAELADTLRILEHDCRHSVTPPDFGAWRCRFEPALAAAPDQARTLAAAAER